MKIVKDDLKNGGCEICDRAKYKFNPNDSSDVKVSYPYDFIYRVELGHTIHKICKDCLMELHDEIENVTNKE